MNDRIGFVLILSAAHSVSSGLLETALKKSGQHCRLSLFLRSPLAFWIDAYLISPFRSMVMEVVWSNKKQLPPEDFLFCLFKHTSVNHLCLFFCLTWLQSLARLKPDSHVFYVFYFKITLEIRNAGNQKLFVFDRGKASSLIQACFFVNFNLPERNLPCPPLPYNDQRHPPVPPLLVGLKAKKSLNEYI